ncbi:helix-turn-helix transcriptional regulator [Ulvibacter antarcticus]|uniref:AraC-like DNA-binding protein n=1 Tax=Ulvibacter antarcticus TaxID=442714 RepID=A0A3L9YZZ8_9FLAO|nr:response regulator transcription factor [Ulvibacter antarcticus]RMA66196.1 AraC-like DNA-binding protein [Ulvibacter antarcticus]
MKILTKGTYYGEMRSEVDSSGVILSEYQYLHPKTDWHFHENPYFMYVLQGDMLDVNKKQKTTCPPGSFLFHNWQEPHFNSKESKAARGFHIEFERKWFQEKKIDVDLWEGSNLIEDPRLHHILAKIYFEFNCRDNYSKVSIDLLLLQLCESTNIDQIPKQTKEPSWIAPLKDLIHENSENLSLQRLSDTLKVHPVHLSRAIPKYLSTTLGDYIRQQKIKQALGYLMNPNYSLTEIAYLCGFSDQSHFTRTFKLYFQKTPKDFRLQLTVC